MFHKLRALSAYILTSTSAEKVCRFLAKSAVNAENYNMKWNGESRAIKEILSKLPDNCVVYDVGSNMGEWSEEVLKIKPNCQLYAFEMIPEFAENSKALIGDRVHNIGLSDSEAEMEVFQYGGGAAISEMSHNPKAAKKVSVKLVKGDDLELAKPDFIKIDVEGHEIKVLKGFENTIKTHKPIIQFEYGTCAIGEHSLLKDIFDYLDDYDIYQIFPRKLIKREYKPSLENFWTVNYIAMPKE